MKRERERDLRERERERMSSMRNTVTTDEWFRSTSHASRPDTYSMIDIQVRFASQSILPFQNLDIPVPRANPTDYREPQSDYNDEE